MRDLLPGDELVGRDGRVSRVEETLATGVWEKVYNFRVAEYHTYFVGDDGWGFDVWAHNACTQHLVGDAGERAARAHVRAMPEGFDRVFSIRNNSNHGIDMVASRIVNVPGIGPVRQYSFFEVKATAYTTAPGFSPAQSRPDYTSSTDPGFIVSRLRRAAGLEAASAWNSYSPARQAVARRILASLGDPPRIPLAQRQLLEVTGTLTNSQLVTASGWGT